MGSAMYRDFPFLATEETLQYYYYRCELKSFRRLGHHFAISRLAYLLRDVI